MSFSGWAWQAELGQHPEVLGGGCKVELVAGAVGTAQAWATVASPPSAPVHRAAGSAGEMNFGLAGVGDRSEAWIDAIR